ncbi:hypothetical protein [Methylobacterium sp. J-077]|uniref:hypothetical protein n=1 Tax=Methylobacterium sp. J-077 TaxID=2836656 RepID=UPI001FBB7F02|nr:hypothetical protein [Methylobacterium sp. J-077]MCJ2126665.1 hypothetical protein [Methylobacterium sp. J-077]
MIDLGSLKTVPGLETAVEAHAAAECALAANPSLADGNPTTFLVTFTLLAWAKAGGDNAKLLFELERSALRAALKD